MEVLPVVVVDIVQLVMLQVEELLPLHGAADRAQSIRLVDIDIATIMVVLVYLLVLVVVAVITVALHIIQEWVAAAMEALAWLL
jgi:hypothetical protein